jgi:FK506-binding nuclear protein
LTSSFKLRSVIFKGWEVGIAGMQVGGERELVIPPAMAYGNKANDSIPAGSTLHFSESLHFSKIRVMYL